MTSRRARQLVVVRRGEADIFRRLQEQFGQGPEPAGVIWDRRVRDRRVIIQDVAVERRRGERRAPLDATTWSRRGYIVARADRPGADALGEPGGTRPAGGRPDGGAQHDRLGG